MTESPRKRDSGKFYPEIEDIEGDIGKQKPMNLIKSGIILILTGFALVFHGNLIIRGKSKHRRAYYDRSHTHSVWHIA